jgi:hypothetical protein
MDRLGFTKPAFNGLDPLPKLQLQHQPPKNNVPRGVGGSSNNWNIYAVVLSSSKSYYLSMHVATDLDDAINYAIKKTGEDSAELDVFMHEKIPVSKVLDQIM